MLDRGFTEQVFVDEGLTELSAMAWAPDGSNRLFVVRKAGEIRVVKDGVVLPIPWATVSPLETSVESGLVGFAFDPAFATNHYVYVFATISQDEQQILRYTDVDGVGTDKTVILAGLPTRGVNHNGGGMAFGPDGMLYFGVGDEGIHEGIGDDLASLASKIGRTRTDGTAPEDNPFFDGPGPNNDYIWARGFRNPFGLTFQPATGRLWVDVAGNSYEQIFSVGRGDHAGWATYEGNQPAGFLAPVIQYKTNWIELGEFSSTVEVERRNGVATFTFPSPHFFRPGEALHISSVGDVSFHGDFHVASVPTPESFTVVQPGPDLRSNHGSFAPQFLGGSVTGGAFYEGSSFPPEYQGDYFFGDFNSGLLIHASTGADGSVTRVEPWSRGLGGVVDVTVGPDGALYYADFYTGRIYRATYTGRKIRLLASRTHLQVEEGRTTSFTVRLEEAPLAPISLFIALYDTPDTELSVLEGDEVMFTPDNYATPQTVILEAGQDEDSLHDSLFFSVGGVGLEPQEMDIQVSDDDLPGLVVSNTVLSLQESQKINLEVSLDRPPPAEVVVQVAVAEGKGVEIFQGAVLKFTPADFATPRPLVLYAGEDQDTWDDQARVQLFGAGVRAASITASVEDNDPMAPVFTSLPEMRAVAGVPYRYDADTQALPVASYALEDGPEGMTVNADTGVVSWTPVTPGQYEISLRASNAVSTDSLQGFTLTVLPGAADGGASDGGSGTPDGGTLQDGGSEMPGMDGGVNPPREPDSSCGCTQGTAASDLLMVGVLASLVLARSLRAGNSLRNSRERKRSAHA
ncbi:PQQ-dependent sugar dehydrogenase [Hyalangium versicolor]|uniref:PQQ-dependent sugar dehydrogenase n=1 Tax=Hyalangium versicolor TaxID=2861190 RepID=UPI001CCE0B4B|nr:PQQ-dependent sugar dehydrogenase [Hyalangium versicolor]